MIRAKITKNNGEWVYILTENSDSLVVKRPEIDFGILVGDSIFVNSQSGVLTFSRFEKGDVLSGDTPYFFDEKWGEREAEYKANVTGYYDSLSERLQKETAKLDKKTDEIIDSAIKETKGSLAVVVWIILLTVLLILFLLSL